MERTIAENADVAQLSSAQLGEIAKKVRTLERMGLGATAQIGELLQKVFERAGHKEYVEWLKAEFSWSARSAANYRNVYKFSCLLETGAYVGVKKCDLASLNISPTAIYAMMEIKNGEKIIKDVVKLARRGRVVRATVLRLIAESRATAAKPSAEDDAARGPEAQTPTSSSRSASNMRRPTESATSSADDAITAALSCLHASGEEQLIEASRAFDGPALRHMIALLELAFQQLYGDHPAATTAQLH